MFKNLGKINISKLHLPVACNSIPTGSLEYQYLVPIATTTVNMSLDVAVTWTQSVTARQEEFSGEFLHHDSYSVILYPGKKNLINENCNNKEQALFVFVV